MTCLTYFSLLLHFFLFSTGYLGLYIVYVLTVIVSAYVYNRQKHQLNGSAQSSGREQGEETAVFVSTIIPKTHIAHFFYYLKISLQFLNAE